MIATLYEKLRLLINFFYPSVRLLDKQRHGARMRKIYLIRGFAIRFQYIAQQQRPRPVVLLRETLPRPFPYAF